MKPILNIDNLICSFLFRKKKILTNERIALMTLLISPHVKWCNSR